jgi:predicted phosphodiesterase
MRVAVISDVHGNFHALAAVLAELAREPPDAVWCLGDVVGYGPRPNRCCAEVRAIADVCLAGNHDLGVLGAIDLAEFTHDAAASARWTRSVLSEESRGFLEGLRPATELPDAGADLYHASPRDPVWEYVLDGEAVVAAFERTTAPLVVIGHSHVPLAAAQGEDVVAAHAPDGTTVDLSGGRWLVNPGSVGQPRDGDPRAAYLLIDLAEKFAAFRRVAYPIEETQREMRERGLPEALASRLAHGL